MDNQELIQGLVAASAAAVSTVDLANEQDRIRINMRTRRIEKENLFLGIKTEHLAMKKVFEADRYLGDTDLSQKSIAIHWINGKNGGVCPVTKTDLSLDGKILFAWDLTNEYTQHEGSITFAVHFFSIVDNAFTFHAATRPKIGTLDITVNASDHSAQTITPSEIEVYVAKMQEMSDYADYLMAECRNLELDAQEVLDTDRLAVSSEEPTNPRATLWIDPTSKEVYQIPEIRDDLVNKVDTWSSDKINQEITGLNNDIQDARGIADNALVVAKGRATGHVFDTLEDMEIWLSSEDNTAMLVLGDNLYIRDTQVPDYWWDGSQAQMLETQKVDLSEYAKSSDFTELKGDFSELPIATVTELISTNGFTPTGASGISKDGNTITGTVPQNGYVVFAQEPITFKQNDIGRKFKIVLDVSHSLDSYKTFTGCSFLYGTVNNWSAVNNFTVKANETKHVEAEYIPTSQGNLGFYCYGGNADINITCKIYDITDIPNDMLSVISFDTLNTVKYIRATIADKAFIADKAIELADKDRDISCWGDSLTYGYGATHGSTDYPTVLSKLTNKTVHNFGVSGEDVTQIMARQGGYYAKVNPFTIPADTTATEIIYTETINTGASGTKLGEKGNLSITNPVDIGGVKGNISYSDSKFYFTRLESGNAVEITRPTQVIPHNAYDRKDDIQCIFVGTNGGWMVTADNAQTRIDKLISEIDMMIDHSSSKQYIVIGMHYYYSWVLYNGLTVDMVETALQRKYGEHYINLRKYMIEYGLLDAGLTPTEADTSAIANGNVPPSLLYSDGLHGNEKFYDILANLVYKHGKILQYW